MLTLFDNRSRSPFSVVLSLSVTFFLLGTIESSFVFFLACFFPGGRPTLLGLLWFEESSSMFSEKINLSSSFSSQFYNLREENYLNSETWRFQNDFLGSPEQKLSSKRRVILETKFPN